MLMLLCVVLVASIGLVWFMRQAADNERLAARQKLLESYQAQLAALRERLESTWTRELTELVRARSSEDSPALFARTVEQGAADAVVFSGAPGRRGYPDALPPPPARAVDPPAWDAARRLERSDPRAAAQAYAVLAREAGGAADLARALQGQARSLLAAGERAGALDILARLAADTGPDGARDPQGRLFAPYAALLAIEIARDTAPDLVSTLLAHLRATATDYAAVALPAPQRRFLLRELQRLAPDEAAARLLAAEDLAADWLAAGDTAVPDNALRPSALADIWQNATPGGDVVLLHHAASLPARLLAAMGATGLPPGVEARLFAPEREVEGAVLSIPAGPSFPGWRLALIAAVDDPLDAATSARLAAYVWIVALVVIAIVVLAALVWGTARRQAALTHLRNDLVANVTHELKTPLASMRLLVDTLLESPHLDEKTTRDYLQLIAAENLRLSRLIGNFLTFSRIERNKLAFDVRETAPADIVAAATTAVRDKMLAPGCRFESDVPSDLPTIEADADALATALINLLDNAWKYSGEEKHIVLTARAVDGSVTFAVRDHGIGLSPQDTARIFRRFEQVRPAGSPAGGVGLGLSIVEYIVRAHRGTVRVESAPGRGSTFTIAIPAAPPPP